MEKLNMNLISLIIILIIGSFPVVAQIDSSTEDIIKSYITAKQLQENCVEAGGSIVYHIVEKGQSWQDISKIYNCPVEDLLILNPDTKTPYVGLEITVAKPKIVVVEQDASLYAYQEDNTSKPKKKGSNILSSILGFFGDLAEAAAEVLFAPSPLVYNAPMTNYPVNTGLVGVPGYPNAMLMPNSFSSTDFIMQSPFSCPNYMPSPFIDTDELMKKSLNMAAEWERNFKKDFKLKYGREPTTKEIIAAQEQHLREMDAALQVMQGNDSQSSIRNTSNTTSSNSSTSKFCPRCGGTGLIIKEWEVPSFGLDQPKKYCNICKKYYHSSTGHAHVTCPECGGKKHM